VYCVDGSYDIAGEAYLAAAEILAAVNMYIHDEALYYSYVHLQHGELCKVITHTGWPGKPAVLYVYSLLCADVLRDTLLDLINR